MNIMTCPVCGSDNLNENLESEILKESFGGQKEVFLKKYKCSSCGTEFDSSIENDIIIRETIDRLKTQSITNIINDFNDINVSMASIERVLSIPQRTITKWKNGNNKPSATAYALFKYLRTFPWLLEVAEHNFDYNIAQKIHISDAIKSLLNTACFDSNNLTDVGILNSANSTIFFQNNENLKMLEQVSSQSSSDGNEFIITNNLL